MHLGVRIYGSLPRVNTSVTECVAMERIEYNFIDPFNRKTKDFCDDALPNTGERDERS
jgi:hypothetical protein